MFSCIKKRFKWMFACTEQTRKITISSSLLKGVKAADILTQSLSQPFLVLSFLFGNAYHRHLSDGSFYFSFLT